MPVTPASHSVRRIAPRGWHARLRRAALPTAAIFLFLALSAGALHHHGSSSSLQRIDCQACAWVHSATGSLSHASPVLGAFDGGSACSDPGVLLLGNLHASPHHGRAPPSFLV